MTVNLSDAAAFCYDFDNVFYNSRQIKGMYEICDEVMAHAACSILGEAIDFSTARRIAKEGYAAHGDSITAFCDWGRQQGLDPEQFKAPLFHAYHRNLRKYLERSFPTIFISRPDLKAAFEISQGKVVNGVATHSCATNWAKPLLESMGISRYFSLNAVHGLDEAGFALKHLDPLLVRMSFNSLGVDMQQGCFVEDTPRNLKALKETSPETRCVLIHHGRPLEQQPIYVDDQFSTLLEMKKAYSAELQASRQIILIP